MVESSYDDSPHEHRGLGTMTFTEILRKLESQFARGIITLEEYKTQIAIEMVLIDDEREMNHASD